MTQLLTVLQILLSLVVGVYFFRQAPPRPRPQGRCAREANAEMEHVRRLRSIPPPPSQPLNRIRTSPEFCRDRRAGGGGARPPGRALRGRTPSMCSSTARPGVGKTCGGAAGAGGSQSVSGGARPSARTRPLSRWTATCLRFDERRHRRPALWQRPRPHLPGRGAAGPGRRAATQGGRGDARARRRAVFGRDRRDAPRADEQIAQSPRGPRGALRTAHTYNPEDANTPAYIHDIFQNGLPADFRLIGATTRAPADIPPAFALALHGDLLPSAGARGIGAGGGERGQPRRLRALPGGTRRWWPPMPTAPAQR